MILPKKNINKLMRIENPPLARMDFLRLDKNENLILSDEGLIKQIKSRIDSDFISTYPEVHTLYQKISQWLDINKEQIYISSGSDGAIKSVFEVFVNEGDSVIIPHPTYAMYYVYSEMFGAHLNTIPYDTDLNLQSSKIIEAITDKTKLICIANPNSPTGTIIEQSELLEIIDYAGKKDVLVLLDEAYYLYYIPTLIKYVSSFPNLIVTRSFSKAYGLASARLGYAISNPYIISCLKKVRPMYEVSSYSVLLGNLIIENETIIMEYMKRFNEGKEYLFGELKLIGLKFFNSHANFVLIDVGNRELALRIKEELYKNRILISAGYTDAPLNRCIRVSISEKKHMETLINNLKDILKNC